MILNVVTWEGPLTKEDVFEQRPKMRSRGDTYMDFWGKRLPGRGSGRHQGSAVGSCLKHGWSQGGSDRGSAGEKSRDGFWKLVKCQMTRTF